MDKVRIHQMLEKMTEWCLCEMEKGKEQVCTEELSKGIGMVKDLAEAEKAVWEKCYYKAIYEAMEGAEEERKSYGMDRAGYDRYRYSSGRFAPKGHGHETSMAMATGRAGYDIKMPPWYLEPWADATTGRMGYTEQPRVYNGSYNQGTTASDHGANGTNGNNERSQHQRYQDAKRYYTQSGSMEAKQKRDSEAMEYIYEAVDTMTDIFKGSDPKLQEEIKNDLKKLMREFGM